jgi:tRNA (Thr-GGU) A37 N-methylase
MTGYRLHPVGWVESPLTDREAAPKQGDEGAPPARIVLRPEPAPRRGVLDPVAGPPQPDRAARGHHREHRGRRHRCRHLEAIDGTPVLDVKPVLGPAAGR